MHSAVVAHFRRVDPRLATVISKITSFSEFSLQRADDYFVSLCREIIGQQLGNKAAEAIYSRFTGLFADSRPTPDGILAVTGQQIRDIGTSWGKVGFLQDLARQVNSGAVQVDNLHKLSDDAVRQELQKVKGIGPWTTDMFLMFALAREDVFSFGDLGLQKAIQKLYGLKHRPSVRQMERISRVWSPFRTYACLFLWHSIDAPGI